MKRFSRLLSVFLIALFFTYNVQIFAQPFVQLPETGLVVVSVEEVIDVNSIRVRNQFGQEALVRLIGVSPNPSNLRDGITFLQREIVGHTVLLVSDAGLFNPFAPNTSRWNYRYVFLGIRHINSELILSGLAHVNENHAHAEHFDQLRDATQLAQRFGIGLWASEHHRHISFRYANRLNINTATAAQIQQRTGATATLAQAIVSFRATAVFQQLSDLKFVPGMTREFFENNRNMLGVSTNINTATEEELITVFTQAQAQAIIASRYLQGQGAFASVQELVSRGIMTQVTLNQLNRGEFVSVTDDYEISFSRPGFRANANTANTAQLTRAGASAAQANAITQQRVIMPIRNIQDLTGLAAFSIGNHNLADNLRAFTNINTAPASEIESLFGTSQLSAANLNATVNAILAHRNHSYFTDINQFVAILPAGANVVAITPFIYVDSRPQPQLLNINTATAQQLVEIGVPLATAHQIVSSAGRGNWNVPAQLPNIVRSLSAAVQAQLSVRTNINTATAAEIRSLDPLMSEATINWILRYRDEQIFGSHAELEWLFAHYGQTALLNRISRFIIFR